MPSLSQETAAFFQATGLAEIHAARISLGPAQGWKTTLRLVVPSAAISDEHPPGFTGQEPQPDEACQRLQTALERELPEGDGSGHRAFVAARGAWLLLDATAPRLGALAPGAEMPRVRTLSPDWQEALATTPMPEGAFRSDEDSSAHARLAAAAVFADFHRWVNRLSFPEGGVLHLLRDGHARALLYAPSRRRVHLLAVAPTA